MHKRFNQCFLNCKNIIDAFTVNIQLIRENNREEEHKNQEQKSESDYGKTDVTGDSGCFFQLVLGNHIFGGEREQNKHYSENNTACYRNYHSCRSQKCKKEYSDCYAEKAKHIDNAEKLSESFGCFVKFICVAVTFLTAVLLKICYLFCTVITFFQILKPFH